MLIGQRVAAYEVIEKLGEGGMGEVYRACDPRLGRDVAIKVLPSNVSMDPERLARFEQEARATAALNHPNILAVFDVGTHEGTRYVVSELLEGGTLRTHLESGPLGTRRATEVAIQIARGLGAAHDKGIIHRDLKPENIFITADGRVKILDFGLAKLTNKTEGLEGSLTPTIAPMTQAGLVLGTIGYMAPEQVRGKAADHRADIFGLGTVLFEMLTGKRAFTGETAADTMSAILNTAPPDVSTSGVNVPPALDRIVSRCLEKQPAARFQSADDLAFALENVSGSTASTVATSTAAQRPGQSIWVKLAAGAVAIALVAILGSLALSDARGPISAPAPVLRLHIAMPDGLTLVPAQPPAISPDGSRLAVVAVDDASGKRAVYIRPLENATPTIVQGSDRALFPFWSPDGRRLAFFADARLKIADLAGGTIEDVAPAPTAAAPGLWIDDEILFPRAVGPIVRVSLKDASVSLAPVISTGGVGAFTLAGVLPDRRILNGVVSGENVLSTSGPGNPLSTPIPASAVRGQLYAPWLEDETLHRGALLFVRDTTLLAQPFDGDAGALAGDARPIAQGVQFLIGSGIPLSVHKDLLAYVDASGTTSQLLWMDRQGRPLGSAGSLTGVLRDAQISRDGSRLSLGFVDTANGRTSLRLLDLSRNTVTRLAENLSVSRAVWTPDNSLVVQATPVPGQSAGLSRLEPVEGAPLQPLLQVRNAGAYAPEVSPDGKTLVYTRVNADGQYEIFWRPFDATDEGRAFLTGADYKFSARLSPDGRWLVYASNESGTFEIYVRSFPEGRDKQQISNGGGLRPAWNRSGRELFYMTPDGDLMAVAIGASPTLTVGARTKLFRAPIDPSVLLSFHPYDVHPDGNRFLFISPVAEARHPINVILNWRRLLEGGEGR